MGAAFAGRDIKGNTAKIRSRTNIKPKNIFLFVFSPPYFPLNQERFLLQLIKYIRTIQSEIGLPVFDSAFWKRKGD
jgi:hypothetical protein